MTSYNMTALKALPLSLVLAFPMGVRAQTFNLPQGCTGFVTIQSKDCSVSHHFTCEGDPEGYKRRVDLNEEAITYVGQTDFEAQWIESFHMLAGHSEQLGQSTDPASFSELLSENLDTWDFVMDSDQIGSTRFVGFDRLTGEEETIDGVTLLRTEYEITALAEDGEELWRASGREFISPEWRMFISGESTYINPDDEFSTDGTPVEFIFPGEDGFLSITPKYGCGVVMSSFTPE